MTETARRMQDFVAYWRTLRGDEKGESQVFLDRLFQAFGHAGYKEAGAELEHRVAKQGGGKRFADLVWRPRVLIEMKKRGEGLANHHQQAFDYWLRLVPDRPRYAVLCNFDELWVYDFGTQLDEPMDRVRIDELPERYAVLNFLFPQEGPPLFGNNRVDVTREAADSVARVLNSVILRGEDRGRAQRFLLQCVMAMFAEDFELIPRGFFTELTDDARQGKASSYDLFGGLFRQMNTRERARGGRFAPIPYFNGGLFSVVDPIELNRDELHLLHRAALENNWARIQPQIFGVLFQSSMGKADRHARGAHYTSEADIMRVVLPTVVTPFQTRIDAAGTQKELRGLLDELASFHVLDPACGSGNFLYVAYRELRRLEARALLRLRDLSAPGTPLPPGRVSIRQMHGLEYDPFGAELAKVTLTLAKELAIREMQGLLGNTGLDFDQPLPLDNLDDRIVQGDALFTPWPRVNAVVGNPPFQSKNKLQREMGPAYVRKLRAAYPDVPGRADYCVYWIRRAHDHLEEGQRAGLVGTNTIRQNDSRVGGLDYVTAHGGTLTDAVSSQVWSGDAAVHVSIVNWVRGPQPGPKHLSWQVGDRRDSPWQSVDVPVINSALSAGTDVTAAQRLSVNARSGACYQGQTHGHKGFLLDGLEVGQMMNADRKNAEVIFPYLTADELLSTAPPHPSRYVIDFQPRDVFAARAYKLPFTRVEREVLPAREAAAAEEEQRNAEVVAVNPKAKTNKHHRNFLNQWWLLSYGRGELIEKIASLPRYVACGQVTKRPIFEFVSSEIRPNAALIVFPLSDDYSFGVLQSSMHWEWLKARSSTMKGDFRYTSDTVFDSFPWPQSPTSEQVRAVAEAAVALRGLRNEVMKRQGWSLRDLYRTLDTPGKNPLRDAQERLDAAVRAAYGMPAGADVLAFLLALNAELAAAEARGAAIVGPGLPAGLNAADFTTADAVRPLG
ncbi:class I SAM-dependent DNA methyltransferase [Deinococcus planocerae]|uniref:class I SAM-dependent DNA methyltransferase n=1 Tax=Deinococcus planocerae TaxID=1737569 RepID=UPI000C7F07E2|nr:class I SAM-dependent DNA methyltransferase [Deinococcus planocerae]